MDGYDKLQALLTERGTLPPPDSLEDTLPRTCDPSIIACHVSCGR